MISINVSGVTGVLALIIIVFGVLWGILNFFAAPQLPTELQQYVYQLAGAFFWIWAVPFAVVIIVFVFRSVYE